LFAIAHLDHPNGPPGFVSGISIAPIERSEGLSPNAHPSPSARSGPGQRPWDLMTRPSRIAVVGSSNIDFVMKLTRLPQVGETMTDAVFMQTYGGKGANQATAAARAGGEVWFVNCVGTDGLTRQMLEGFRRDGIHTEYICEVDGCSSGAALVMIGEEGHNYLAVAPGANYSLGRSHIDRAAGLFDEKCIALFQNEITPDTLLYGLARAKEGRAKVMLNFAPVRPLPEDPLRLVSILVVNKSEAEQLTGREILDEGETVCHMLRDRGPEVVVITLGERGGWVSSRELTERVPPFRVTPVDTTGAGDTFCGALAVAVGEGKDLRVALRFASAAAALSVTRTGAQPSIPVRSEIDSFLEDHGIRP